MPWLFVLLMLTEHISSVFPDLEALPMGVYVWPWEGKKITQPRSASAELSGNVFAVFLPTLLLVVNVSLGSWCACNSAASC
jgi:hypothetical protein